MSQLMKREEGIVTVPGRHQTKELGDKRIMAIRSLLGASQSYRQLDRRVEAKEILLLAIKLLGNDMVRQAGAAKNHCFHGIPEIGELCNRLARFNALSNSELGAIRSLAVATLPRGRQLEPVHQIARNAIMASEGVVA